MDAKKRKTASVGSGRFVCNSLSSAQSNAHDQRRLVTLCAGAAGSRVRASEKTARIAGRGRLEGRGYQFTETASNETDCTRDSALNVRKSESRVSAKARNPAKEMRFPASR
jgi:hypothetical protein